MIIFCRLKKYRVIHSEYSVNGSWDGLQISFNYLTLGTKQLRQRKTNKLLNICMYKWHECFGHNRLSAVGIDDIIWFLPLRSLLIWWGNSGINTWEKT